jgi:electron transfer flavoprotein alpha subunit
MYVCNFWNFWYYIFNKTFDKIIMTPKEKAKQLVEKMIIYHSPDDKDYEAAKDCALIAVDEILKLDNPNTYNYLTENKEHLIVELANKYWQEVKKQLEAL